MSTGHATAVRLGDAGVLIRGEAGAGKSTLALALIERARWSGRPAGLVADDRVIVEAGEGGVVLRCPPSILGMIELRGHGVLGVPAAGAAVLRLVVDLVPEASVERMPSSRAETIAGVAIPAILAPRRAEGIAARLVEAALGILQRDHAS